MAAETTRVAVQITADSSKYVSEANKAAKATSGIDRAQTAVAKSQGRSVAAMAAIGGAYALAGAQALQFGRDSIAAATNLQDSQAKVGVVFGKSSDDVLRFAEDSKRAFGLTRTQALDAASTFGVFGKAAGKSGQDLAQWSEQLTQRSVDLSSMFGGSVEEAITAVGAALRGEYEPARRYGVLIDENTLKQEALKQGLIATTTQALDPQTRALVAAQVVLRQTSDAAGDYIRTQGGAANSVRDFSAAWGRFKEEAGSTILPLFTKITQAATGAIKSIDQGSAGPMQLDALGQLNAAALGIDTTTASTDALDTAATSAAGSVSYLSATAAGSVGSFASMDAALQNAVSTLSGLIDANQGAIDAQSQLLGMDDRFRAALVKTTSARHGASKAEKKALQERIDGLRKADKAEEDAEIARARRAAKRKAEARADAGARKDVRKGIADFIANDRRARAGQDIDGFKNRGSVGEATGSLTKAEQKRLDAQIDAIRKRHQKALDAQVKGLRDAQKAAGGSATATIQYSRSLDMNTEAGRKNIALLSNEVDVVQAYAEGQRKAAEENGATVEEATAIYEKALSDGHDAILKHATDWGFARDAVEAYLKKVGLVPKTISTTLKVKTDGIKKAQDDLTDLEKQLRGIGVTIDKQWGTGTDKARSAIGDWQSGPVNRVPKKGMATGGKIHGPGTTTSDSILTPTSRDEWVVRAAGASQFGDQFMAAVNRGDVYSAARLMPGGAGGSAGGGYQINAQGWTIQAPSPVAAAGEVFRVLTEDGFRRGVVR